MCFRASTISESVAPVKDHFSPPDCRRWRSFASDAAHSAVSDSNCPGVSSSCIAYGLAARDFNQRRPAPRPLEGGLTFSDPGAVQLGDSAGVPYRGIDLHHFVGKLQVEQV